MSEAHVAVSPGIGFGPMGEGFVRFSLIEDHDRIRKATKQIGEFLKTNPGAAKISDRALLHV